MITNINPGIHVAAVKATPKNETPSPVVVRKRGPASNHSPNKNRINPMIFDKAILLI